MAESELEIEVRLLRIEREKLAEAKRALDDERRRHHAMKFGTSPIAHVTPLASVSPRVAETLRVSEAPKASVRTTASLIPSRRRGPRKIIKPVESIVSQPEILTQHTASGVVVSGSYNRGGVKPRPKINEYAKHLIRTTITDDSSRRKLREKKFQENEKEDKERSAKSVVKDSRSNTHNYPKSNETSSKNVSPPANVCDWLTRTVHFSSSPSPTSTPPDTNSPDRRGDVNNWEQDSGHTPPVVISSLPKAPPVVHYNLTTPQPTIDLTRTSPERYALSPDSNRGSPSHTYSTDKYARTSEREKYDKFGVPNSELLRDEQRGANTYSPNFASYHETDQSSPNKGDAYFQSNLQELPQPPMKRGLHMNAPRVHDYSQKNYRPDASSDSYTVAKPPEKRRTQKNRSASIEMDISPPRAPLPKKKVINYGEQTDYNGTIIEKVTAVISNARSSDVLTPTPAVSTNLFSCLNPKGKIRGPVIPTRNTRNPTISKPKKLQGDIIEIFEGNNSDTAPDNSKKQSENQSKRRTRSPDKSHSTTYLDTQVRSSNSQNRISTRKKSTTPDWFDHRTLFSRSKSRSVSAPRVPYKTRSRSRSINRSRSRSRDRRNKNRSRTRSRSRRRKRSYSRSRTRSLDKRKKGSYSRSRTRSTSRRRRSSISRSRTRSKSKHRTDSEHRSKTPSRKQKSESSRNSTRESKNSKRSKQKNIEVNTKMRSDEILQDATHSSPPLVLKIVPSVPKETTNDDEDLIGVCQVKDTTLFSRPQRFVRPNKIVMILRGLPGSGKTTVAKNIDSIETRYSKKTKFLVFDDYFKEDDGAGCIDYDWDDTNAPNYLKQMFEEFQMAIKKNEFDLIILDAVNAKLEDFEDFYKYAMKNSDWTPYVMDVGKRDDVMNYALRQDLKRSIDQCVEFKSNWEETPQYMNTVLCDWIWKSDFNEAPSTSDKKSKSKAHKLPMKPFKIARIKQTAPGTTNVLRLITTAPPMQKSVVLPVLPPAIHIDCLPSKPVLPNRVAPVQSSREVKALVDEVLKDQSSTNAYVASTISGQPKPVIKRLQSISTVSTFTARDENAFQNAQNMFY